MILTMAINEYSYKENIINNNCEFQILRIAKNEVKCYDTGKYVKYCNHYAIPTEFQIIKEIGIGNKEILTFKPQGIYTETENTKQKDASFYYKFTCNNENNIPNLELIIYPSSDVNPITNVFTIILIIIFICIIFVYFSDDNSRNNNDFALGYLIGNSTSSSYRKTYSE